MVMRTNLPSFKHANRRAIWLMICIDTIFIISMLSNYTTLQVAISNFSLYPMGLLAAFGPTIAVFFNSLIPSNVKASIVYFRLKDALPGHRAFTELAVTDPRINLKLLKKRIGKFPNNPRDQNASWYKLLQKHQADIKVHCTHKQFLLFRDATSLTLLIIGIAWEAAILAGSPLSTQRMLVSILVAQFFLLKICARNTGIRLVQNVLALEAAYEGV